LLPDEVRVGLSQRKTQRRIDVEARRQKRLHGGVLFAPLGVSLWLGMSCGQTEEVVPAACADASNTAIYDARIAPLLSDDRPKSCNACHLSGIDMTLFVRATPCETMACLGELGLVDLSAPEGSRVLDWIDRAKPLSPLIDASVVEAEHDGFLEWIRHNAECGRFECADVVCTQRERDPFCDVAPEPFTAGISKDAGGCGELALERLFRDTIYESRGRCFPCHFSAEAGAAPEALHFIEQTGSCDSSSLETMRNVVDAGLVDVQDPERSLLLLKPLAEGGGGVPHGGHEKFSPGGDPGYDNFVYWLKRYAGCQGQQG
jgi:hypothetical protein